MSETKPNSVEEYIAYLPANARNPFNELRSLLKRVAPAAVEELKWGRPVMVSDTILFSYSAHKAHLSFFPTGPALDPFREDLRGFVVKKDSVQFPYERPLPKDLIVKIAEFRKNDVEINGAKWRY